MTPTPILLEELSVESLAAQIPLLLCDDSFANTNSPSLENQHHFDSSVMFSISDRINGIVPLDESESNFESWLSSLVLDTIHRLRFACIDWVDSEQLLCSSIIRNLLFLFQLPYRGRKAADWTSNQEVPDIVKRVLMFTLGHDPFLNVESHAYFNYLALQLVPAVIYHLHLDEETRHEVLLRFAISAGLCGLDLKGASAAASAFAQPGIPMSHIIPHNLVYKDLDAFCRSLADRASGPTPIFHLEMFLSELTSNKTLLWITDDLIESIFDLMFLQRILKDLPDFRVILVPKNGSHANDFSWSHLELLLSLPLFESLSTFALCGRFKWIRSGPRMATVNLMKVSKEFATQVSQSHLAVVKGCRAHELLQSVLPLTTYTGYVVARTFSEVVSGFDASQAPLLFFRLSAMEHSFYGFSQQGENTMMTNDKRIVSLSLSTTNDHFRRQGMTSAAELVSEYRKVMSHIPQIQDRDALAAVAEANSIAEKLVEITKATYNRTAGTYASIRWEEPHDLDKRMWSHLLLHVRSQIDKRALVADDPISLLDVATGNGRDLQYAQNNLNLQAIGIDNSTSMVAIIEEMANKGKVKPGSIYLCDMRDLSIFPGYKFDIVRQNASILHLPLLTLGIMADKAISESHRVLKVGGVLFVFVKAGEGVDVVDTGEGLGYRFFQFYNRDSLSLLLQRNSFKVLEIIEEVELRGENRIPWIGGFAIKV